LSGKGIHNRALGRRRSSSWCRWRPSTDSYQTDGADRVQVRRLAAHEVEGAVIRILVEALTSPERLLEWFGTGSMPADQIRRMLGRAARLAVAFSSSPRDRAKPVRGLVEKVKAAIATFAGPMVRIRLPPAVGQQTFGFLSRRRPLFD
jgi:hypothetical protein